MKTLTLSLLSLFLGCASLQAQERETFPPFKEVENIAFCNFNDWHPVQYLKDNNWDILCALRTPGTLARLDSLGIRWNQSQIRLLQIGGLLDYENKRWHTQMPIFSREQTAAIRRDTRAFTDSLFSRIEPSCRAFVDELKAQGYGANAFSLLFSYVIDSRSWDHFPSMDELGHHATWDGLFWVLYEPRKMETTGTNTYGYVSVNWTDSLKTWPDSDVLEAYSQQLAEGKLKVDDPKLAASLARYGYTDKEGNPTLPVMRYEQDNRLNRLADQIVTLLADGVKAYMPRFAPAYGLKSEDEAGVIFFHEVMWDVLTLLEEKGIVTRPAILKGETDDLTRLRDVSFICL